MVNRYKTHYKPNPCGSTGFQSNYTTNLNDVTCIPCLVKNMMEAHTKKEEIKMKELLERLEKADPDSFRNLKDIIETHTIFTEKLNMLLDAIPKFIALQTGEDESEVRDIIPKIMDCNTPDEVCDIIIKWIKESE